MRIDFEKSYPVWAGKGSEFEKKVLYGRFRELEVQEARHMCTGTGRDTFSKKPVQSRSRETFSGSTSGESRKQMKI